MVKCTVGRHSNWSEMIYRCFESCFLNSLNQTYTSAFTPTKTFDTGLINVHLKHNGHNWNLVLLTDSQHVKWYCPIEHLTHCLDMVFCSVSAPALESLVTPYYLNLLLLWFSFQSKRSNDSIYGNIWPIFICFVGFFYSGFVCEGGEEACQRNLSLNLSFI